MLVIGCARSICSVLLLFLLVGLPDVTVSLTIRRPRPCSRTAVSTLPSSRWHCPRAIPRVSSPLHQLYVPSAGVDANAVHLTHPGALMHAASALSNIIRSITTKWLNILTAAWQRLWSPDTASGRPVRIELTRNIEVVVTEHGQFLETKRVEEMNTAEETTSVDAVHQANDARELLEDTTRSPATATFSPSDAAITRTDVAADHATGDLLMPVRELARAAIEEATHSAAAISREPCKAFDIRNLPSAFQTSPLSTWQLPDVNLMEAKALIASTLNANDISVESVQSASVTGVLAVLITQATFSAVLPVLFTLLRSMAPRDSGDSAALSGPTAALQRIEAATKAAATLDEVATLLATAVAQYSVPLRVGFALTIAPWVDANITKRWLSRGKEKGQGPWR